MPGSQNFQPPNCTHWGVAALTAASVLFGSIDSVQAIDSSGKQIAGTKASESSATKAEKGSQTSPGQSGQDEDTVDSQQQTAYELRFRFQPDQQLRYESRQTVIQSGTAPFGTKVEKNVVQQNRIYRIGDVQDDGVASATMQFEYVRMERRVDDQDPVVFDTRMDLEDVPDFFRATATKLQSKAEQFQLMAQGVPLEDEGVESTDPGRRVSFSIPLPADAVRVGDSWTTFHEAKVRLAPGIFRDVKIRKTFRLKAVEEGIARISMSTSLVQKIKDPRVKVQLLQATPSGTFWFDIERGLLTKKELRFNQSVINAMGPRTLVSSQGQTVERLL